MNIHRERSKEIYVTPKTKRRLYFIAKKINGDAPGDKRITQDEIADRMLNEKIEETYPKITGLEKKMNALEDQFVSEL